MSGCTSTVDISWGTLIEFVDPGDFTSWSDIFTTGEVVFDTTTTTLELLENGSLRIVDMYEDTDENGCEGLRAGYSNLDFLEHYFEPPVVDDPTPPKTDDPTPPVVDEPAPPKVVSDPLPTIPNAGMSADTSSPASLLIVLSIILMASGGLVMAASPGKEK